MLPKRNPCPYNQITCMSTYIFNLLYIQLNIYKFLTAYRKVRRHSTRHIRAPGGTISCRHLRESWGRHSPLLEIWNDLMIGLEVTLLSNIDNTSSV